MHCNNNRIVKRVRDLPIGACYFPLIAAGMILSGTGSNDNRMRKFVLIGSALAALGGIDTAASANPASLKTKAPRNCKAHDAPYKN